MGCLMKSDRNQHQHLNTHYLVMMMTNSQNPKTQSQHHNQLKVWCLVIQKQRLQLWFGKQFPPKCWETNSNISKPTDLIWSELNRGNRKCSSNGDQNLSVPVQPKSPEGVYYKKGTIFLLGIHCWKLSVCTASQRGERVAFQSDLPCDWRQLKRKVWERLWSYAFC